MFSEEFLAQLPASIRNRLIDNQTMRVKSITMHCWDNKESFMYEGIPASRSSAFPGDYFDIELKSNAPGYVLTSLLNIDFEGVAKIISDLEWADSDDEYSAPPHNLTEIYNHLLELSDVFGFYLPNEWDRIQYDLESTQEGVASTVATLRKYIAFCENRQLPYTGQFFAFLLSHGYFEIDPIVIMPVEEFAHYDDLFNNNWELVDELDAIYDAFTTGFDPDTTGCNTYSFDPEDRLRSIAMISFSELGSRGKIIRKCQNCGKYFIPSKRSDTLYCDNPSPEAPEMTCKEYGTRRLWYERQKEDELATLSRKIASAKGMLAKRNPDIPQYAESYEYFKAQRLIWMKAVKEGTKTQDEYREWLLLMQSQKRIKEACNGND